MPRPVTGRALWATIAVAIGVAVPAHAGPPQPGAATAAAPLVTIGGPAQLRAARVIQFPVYCSRPCFVKVTVKLVMPGPDLISTVSDEIYPGRPKVDRLTLNRPATDQLKASFREARLWAVARARNLATGARQTDRRSFEFKL